MRNYIDPKNRRSLAVGRGSLKEFRNCGIKEKNFKIQFFFKQILFKTNPKKSVTLTSRIRLNFNKIYLKNQGGCFA